MSVIKWIIDRIRKNIGGRVLPDRDYSPLPA